MAKKNDVDLQTFQIYQDDETNDHTPEVAAPKKKKFSMPSFKKKDKVEKTEKAEKVSNLVDDNDEVDAPSDAIHVDNSNKGAIVKGLGVGIIIVVLIILADQFIILADQFLR